MRENRVDAAACAAVALGLALLAWILVPLLIPDGDTSDPATAAVVDEPGLAAPYSSDDGPPTSDPDASPQQAKSSVSSQVQQGLATFGGGGTQAGLPGSGGVSNQPSHTVTLTLTSEVPLGTVGYIIPTSLRDNYGIRKDAGRTFSITTTVYGEPDYAQGFARAGQRGFPVVCTITVDGRVTERQSTAGPYGALFCQG